jgi:hypothetical protein
MEEHETKFTSSKQGKISIQRLRLPTDFRIQEPESNNCKTLFIPSFNIKIYYSPNLGAAVVNSAKSFSKLQVVSGPNDLLEGRAYSKYVV